MDWHCKIWTLAAAYGLWLQHMDLWCCSIWTMDAVFSLLLQQIIWLPLMDWCSTWAVVAANGLVQHMGCGCR